MLTPFDDEGKPLKKSSGSDGAMLDEGRRHIAVEICYCSTLGDCWLLKSGQLVGETREDVRRCPQKSARTFTQ